MLDNRMQGYLFLQEHVENRRARIDFARDVANMAFLRDAAGGKNVWMVDDEFAELVHQDDAVTLAVFGRSEKMQLHHLAFIAYKLSIDPHGHEMLADSYDVEITEKKALEITGWVPPLAPDETRHARSRSCWPGCRVVALHSPCLGSWTS